jgi:hypothetical protein
MKFKKSLSLIYQHIRTVCSKPFNICIMYYIYIYILMIFWNYMYYINFNIKTNYLILNYEHWIFNFFFNVLTFYEMEA